MPQQLGGIMSNDMHWRGKKKGKMDVVPVHARQDGSESVWKEKSENERRERKGQKK